MVSAHSAWVGPVVVEELANPLTWAGNFQAEGVLEGHSHLDFLNGELSWEHWLGDDYSRYQLSILARLSTVVLMDYGHGAEGLTVVPSVGVALSCQEGEG